MEEQSERRREREREEQSERIRKTEMCEREHVRDMGQTEKGNVRWRWTRGRQMDREKEGRKR